MTDAPARILVVDDDLFTAQLTGLVLEASGYEILLAEGGLDALEKIAADPLIRIVVSDMNMPFIDGVQLFAELRQQGSSLPFVLLTGQDADTLRQDHPEIDAVLAKDESFQTLLPELVGALLARLSGKEGA